MKIVIDLSWQKFKEAVKRFRQDKEFWFCVAMAQLFIILVSFFAMKTYDIKNSCKYLESKIETASKVSEELDSRISYFKEREDSFGN